MRVLLMTTMAASALAIVATMESAHSLPLGGKIATPDAVFQKVQQKEKGMGPGTESQGPGMGTQGGPSGSKMQGQGMQGKGMQGQGGAQLRAGERAGRGAGQGSAQFRAGERAGRGAGGAELRFRERGGTYGYGPRARERGVYIERERRGHGRRGGAYFGPSYGYTSGCAWLRRRALETDSAYWWRRYRACRGG